MSWIDRRSLVALTAAGSIGGLGTGITPLVMGALADAGLAAQTVGLLLTVELLAAFVASVLLAGRMALDSRAAWAALGAVAVALGSALVAGSADHGALMASRILAGVGAGALLASCNAAAAATPQPDRTFAAMSVLQGVVYAILLGALPYPTEIWGKAGIFTAMAGLSLVAIPMMRGLPRVASVGVVSRRGLPPNRARGAAVLVGILVVAVPAMGMWTLAERIGVRTGLSDTEVGAVLGVTNLFGLLGAGLAVWLGTRFGRVAPVLAGLFVMTASTVALSLTSHVGVYSAAQFLWAVSFLFVTPYVLGVAAALDPAGRWSAAAAGVAALGAAMGPAVATALLDAPRALAALNAAAGVLAAVLVGFALRGSPAPPETGRAGGSRDA